MVSLDIQLKDTIFLADRTDKETYKKRLEAYSKEDFIEYLVEQQQQDSIESDFDDLDNYDEENIEEDSNEEGDYDDEVRL